MWTRIDGWILREDELNKPYYCDECLENVTYHTTKATINS